MVGRLIEDKHVWLRSKYTGKCYALDLSSRQLSVRSFCFIGSYLHLSEVLPIELHILITLAIKLCLVNLRALFEIANLQVIPEYHLTAIVSLMSSNNAEEG